MPVPTTQTNFASTYGTPGAYTYNDGGLTDLYHDINPGLFSGSNNGRDLVSDYIQNGRVSSVTVKPGYQYIIQDTPTQNSIKIDNTTNDDLSVNFTNGNYYTRPGVTVTSSWGNDWGDKHILRAICSHPSKSWLKDCYEDLTDFGVNPCIAGQQSNECTKNRNIDCNRLNHLNDTGANGVCRKWCKGANAEGCSVVIAAHCKAKQIAGELDPELCPSDADVKMCSTDVAINFETHPSCRKTCSANDQVINSCMSRWKTYCTRSRIGTDQFCRSVLATNAAKGNFDNDMDTYCKTNPKDDLCECVNSADQATFFSAITDAAKRASFAARPDCFYPKCSGGMSYKFANYRASGCPNNTICTNEVDAVKFAGQSSGNTFNLTNSCGAQSSSTPSTAPSSSSSSTTKSSTDTNYTKYIWGGGITGTSCSLSCSCVLTVMMLVVLVMFMM